MVKQSYLLDSLFIYASHDTIEYNKNIQIYDLLKPNGSKPSIGAIKKDVIYTTESNIKPGPILRVSMIGGDMNNILNNKFILSTSEFGKTFKLHHLDCRIDIVNDLDLNLSSMTNELKIELNNGLPNELYVERDRSSFS